MRCHRHENHDGLWRETKVFMLSERISCKRIENMEERNV